MFFRSRLHQKQKQLFPFLQLLNSRAACNSSSSCSLPTRTGSFKLTDFNCLHTNYGYSAEKLFDTHRNHYIRHLLNGSDIRTEFSHGLACVSNPPFIGFPAQRTKLIKEYELICRPTIEYQES